MNASYAGFYADGGEGRIWLVGQDWKWRTFRASDLQPVGPPAEELAPADRVPILMDGVGGRWLLRGDELIEHRGTEARPVRLPERNVQLWSVSPDGRRVAVVFGSGRILVLDGATLEPVASLKPGGVASRLSWSAGGQRLAAALPGGGVILDVDHAAIVASRCGGDFQVRATPPPAQFARTAQVVMCE